MEAHSRAAGAYAVPPLPRSIIIAICSRSFLFSSISWWLMVVALPAASVAARRAVGARSADGCGSGAGFDVKDIVDDEDEEEGGPIGPIECEGNPPWAPGFAGSRRTGGAFLAPPAIFASRAAILRLTRSDSARSCVTVSAIPRSVRGGGR